jgi:hypothetical protein
MDDGQSLEVKAEGIAERLRQEPYRLLSNDCLIKSIRFARQCRRLGIDAKVVLCLGSVSARIPSLARRLTVPVLHAWGEVGGERIEVSRPLGSEGMLGIIPVDIKPLMKVRLSAF